MRAFAIEVFEADGSVVVPSEHVSRQLAELVHEVGLDETARRLQYYLDHEYVELSDGATARRVP